ncbi:MULTISPECIES: hypothetical protein [Paenibacillus]|uniref:hypothetical protein n=1 Tax=Paenibacillus TaxID=44249 RepID=UPI00159500BB|nr:MULTISPECIES: hypothetical protein [Paenibacillus]
MNRSYSHYNSWLGSMQGRSSPEPASLGQKSGTSMQGRCRGTTQEREAVHATGRQP